ncbi:MAG: ABC transporter permease [Chloroflexi bacterium]|nr:ABC transporter permease [Chloroflexota bacterium]
MSRPAPLAGAVAAQTLVELRLTARRSENLLAMVVIPAAVFAFFASVDLLPVVAGETRSASLLPGTLALAIIATGLVNLGIATAYERDYGVLKRLGGSPLGRLGLVLAKVGAVLIVELVLVVLLIVVAAAAFGWRPGEPASLLAFLAVVGLGTGAFAGLGLAMAGALRAEATLTLANVVFVACILLGGTVVPTGALPDPLVAVVSVLPAAALTEALRAALGGGGDIALPLAILGVWCAGALGVAARTFRWD